jgi:hypothetical protein
MSETTILPYSIGITTFSKRFDMFKKTLLAIREYRKNIPILVAINGLNNTEFDETYRTSVLELIGTTNNVYPIFFPSFRGYAKLVNTLVIHSPTNLLLCLNDDVDILNESFFDTFESINSSITRMCKFNGSFSHACYTKDGMIDIGWLDERLLGIGEEDGDITYRYIDKYNEAFPEYYLPGIHNIVSDVRDDNITPGVGKYSRFNREFIGFWNHGTGKYIQTESSTIVGMFGQPYTKVMEDLPQYPYEHFYLINRDKL